MKVIENAKAIHSFKPCMEPVERVTPGEIIKVIMNDCYMGQITREDQPMCEVDFSKINPATGPIYVDGAQPGDLLKVSILALTVSSRGIIRVVEGEGILGDRLTRTVTRILPIRSGACYIGEVAVPIKPMIGVIGVAPSDEDGELRTIIPWKHGGNMDNADIGEGSRVYLPVRQRGALLAMGDCHAAMGDGELCGSGLEVAGEAIIQIDVIEGKATEWPMVDTRDSTMVVASAGTLYDAGAAAADQAVTLLSRGLGVSWEDAYMVASLAVDLRICQVVDPKMTVRAVIPKSLIHTEALIEAAAIVGSAH